MKRQFCNFKFHHRPGFGNNPLALVQDLDGARGEPHLDLGAGKSVRDAVVMGLDLDVVVEADAAGSAIRRTRTGFPARP